jgi:hypothetical protein
VEKPPCWLVLSYQRSRLYFNGSIECAKQLYCPIVFHYTRYINTMCNYVYMVWSWTAILRPAVQLHLHESTVSPGSVRLLTATAVIAIVARTFIFIYFRYKCCLVTRFKFRSSSSTSKDSNIVDTIVIRKYNLSSCLTPAILIWYWLPLYRSSIPYWFPLNNISFLCVCKNRNI